MSKNTKNQTVKNTDKSQSIVDNINNNSFTLEVAREVLTAFQKVESIPISIITQNKTFLEGAKRHGELKASLNLTADVPFFGDTIKTPINGIMLINNFTNQVKEKIPTFLEELDLIEKEDERENSEIKTLYEEKKKNVKDPKKQGKIKLGQTIGDKFLEGINHMQSTFKKQVGDSKSTEDLERIKNQQQQKANKLFAEIQHSPQGKRLLQLYGLIENIERNCNERINFINKVIPENTATMENMIKILE